MKNKTRDVYRYERNRAIRRKKQIIKKLNNYFHYKYEGQLSKGKIHCSCPVCKYRWQYTPSHSDSKKILSLEQKEKEWQLLGE